METGTTLRPPRPWAAGLLLAIALAGSNSAIRPALSQEAPKAPAPAPEAPALLTLENGMRVFLRPVPAAKHATQLLLFARGSNEDPSETSDGVHLLEHLFLYVGSESRVPRGRKGSDPWRGLSLSGLTYRDHMIVRWTCPPEQLALEMAEVAGRMRGLDIDDATWKQERAAVLEQIHEKPGNQNARVLRFSRLTLDHVRTLEESVIRPDNAILCILGNFDPAEVRARLQETYGALPRPPIPTSEMPIWPRRSRGGTIETRTGERSSSGRSWITVRHEAPDWSDPDLPAWLQAAWSLDFYSSGGSPWTVKWESLVPGNALSIEALMDPGETAEEAWERIRAMVEDHVKDPPDPSDRALARDFARRKLGLDDAYIAERRSRLESAAEHEAEAIWRGVDLRALADGVSTVTPASWASVKKYWVGRWASSAVASVPPCPTDWWVLPNGPRVGFHSLDEVTRSGVALLLPFGRDNGPSPMLARLFARGRTGVAGIERWSARSAPDCTAVWWEGPHQDLDRALEDLAIRLGGLTPTAEDIERERASLHEPDPYPEPNAPAAVSTALLEGSRALSGRPRQEAVPPDSPAEAAAQLAAWFQPANARIVIAGPGEVDDAYALLLKRMGPLTSIAPSPRTPVRTTLPPFEGAERGAAGVECQAFPLPPPSAYQEFAASAHAVFAFTLPHQDDQSMDRLPEVLYDMLMDPGVVIFAAAPGEPGFDRIRLFKSQASRVPEAGRGWFSRSLGYGLSFGAGSSDYYVKDKDVSPYGRAVRAALLDFRGTDEFALSRAFVQSTAQARRIAAKTLAKTKPVVFRVKVEAAK